MKKKIALTSKEVAEMRSYNELKSKNAKLEMTNERSAKKISDLTNEVSKLKLERENILKELAISKRANEKIIGEKSVIESQLKDTKQYIVKLENKIFELSKSKTQSVYELNQKLKKENEEYANMLSQSKDDNNKLKLDIEKYKKEIAVLNNALNIKVNNLKFKNDIKSSLFYDVGLIKEEMDELKAKTYQKDSMILDLKSEVDKKNALLQDLTFDKANVVEELMTIKEENEKLIEQTNKDMEEIEKLKREIEISSKRLSEYKTISSQRESSPKEKTEDDTKKKKETNPLLSDIQSELKNEFKIKYQKAIEANTKLTEQIKNLENEKKNMNNTIKELKEEVMQKGYELSELNIKIKEENDNKERMKLQNNKINESLSQIKKEKENLSKQNVSISMQKESLEQENKKIKEQNHSLLITIEKLKSANFLLHQNLSNAIQSSESILTHTDNINPVDIGYAKVTETNLLDLIKRETERNKEYNAQIEKITSS